MDVGYEANDSGSKHSSGVFLSYFILHSKVGLKLFFMFFLYSKKPSGLTRCYPMLAVINKSSDGGQACKKCLFTSLI